MATPNWTSAVIDAADLAYAAADKPILAAQTMSSTTTARWNEEGTTSGDDHTDTYYPVYRCFDGMNHLSTRTSTLVASNIWYLVFDFGSTGIEFDAIAFISGNFGTLGLTTVQIDIDTTGAFSGATTIASFGTQSTDTRQIKLACYHTGDTARRYSDVRYARLKLAKAANFTPQLHEIWFLRRRQLHYKLNYPFDNNHLVDDVSTSDSMSGVTQSIINNRRRKYLEGNILLTSSTERDDLLAWHRQASDQFIYIEDPGTYPFRFNVMNREDISANIYSENYGMWKFEIEAKEQGPESYFLDQELY